MRLPASAASEIGSGADPPGADGEGRSARLEAANSSGMAGECTRKEIWASGQGLCSPVISNVGYSRRKLLANAAIAVSRVVA
jgi:hypothetical protein